MKQIRFEASLYNADLDQVVWVQAERAIPVEASAEDVQAALEAWALDQLKLGWYEVDF